MSYPGHFLPPTSSLPRVRSLPTLTEEQISSALRNLHSIYCPLRLPRASFKPDVEPKRLLLSVPPTPADSGYASHNEDEDDDNDNDGEDAAGALASLRADEFERNYAVRWLTAFIARSEELYSLDNEDTRMRLIDEAAFVLASFNDTKANDDDGDGDEEDDGIVRNFSFPLSPGSAAPSAIEVRLNDAMLSGTDHTDVGLQSWGASIVLSSMMCASPARFGLQRSPSTIIELGAGTGLVSLTLAKLLPHLSSSSSPTIIATDYHPAVLENLAANITTNFPSSSSSSSSISSEQPTPAPVQTSLLDWSAPHTALAQPPLSTTPLPAPFLVAADVIYAPEHAVWLRDCAGSLLAPHGVFWLIATARPRSARFAGLVDAVEEAFADEASCPTAKVKKVVEGGEESERGVRLRIVEVERLEKRSGVGRGDEGFYKLYRIGWV